MKKLLNIVLNSHIFIGLCSISLLAYANVYTKYSFPTEYYIFIMSGTMIIYNLHRLVSSQMLTYSKAFRRIEQIKEYKVWYLISTPILCVLALYCLFTFPYQLLLFLFVPILLALLYVTPLFSGRKRLRDFPYIKIFLIAICWTLLVHTIPILFYAQETSLQYNFISSSEMFFYILGITIPFDYRDLALDKELKTPTLVKSLGNQSARLVAMSYIFFAFVLHLLSQLNGATPEYLKIDYILIALTYLVIGLLVSQAFKKRGDAYYGIILDGTMILLAIMAIIAQYIFNNYL